MSSLTTLGQVRRYALRIARQCGLYQWDFQVVRGEDKADYLAEVRVYPHRRAALLLLGPNFFNLSDEEMRDTVFHEVLHVVWRDLDVHLEVLSHLLDERMYKALVQYFQHSVEEAIEQLTVYLGKYMPLPVEAGT